MWRLWISVACCVVMAGCAGKVPPPMVTASYVGNDGGLQFLITPDDARIYVDAEYKGLARDFTGDKVLFLNRGLHAVEVRRDGYLTFFRQVQISQGLIEILVYTLPFDGEGPYTSGPKPSR